MPDYYSNYCLCFNNCHPIGMRDLDGNETSQYLVVVYNVNEVFIGLAFDKAEYVQVWNSDPDNQAVGTLFSGVGPFGFRLCLNDGQELPDYVIGVSQSSGNTGGRPIEGLYDQYYDSVYE